MSLPRIHYQVFGQDDYMLIIDLDPNGGYTIDFGDHTSHKPRSGGIDSAHRDALVQALGNLGPARDHPAPEGVEGFKAQLTLGEGPTVQRFQFWEGALEQDAPLRAVIRALEVLA